VFYPVHYGWLPCHSTVHLGSLIVVTDGFLVISFRNTPPPPPPPSFSSPSGAPPPPLSKQSISIRLNKNLPAVLVSRTGSPCSLAHLEPCGRYSYLSPVSHKNYVVISFHLLLMSGKLPLSCIPNNLLHPFLLSLSKTYATRRFLVDPKCSYLVANYGYRLRTLANSLPPSISAFPLLQIPCCYSSWNSLIY